MTCLNFEIAIILTVQQLFADRYTITNQIIGSGGNGSVYVAVHKKTHRQLACKVVAVLSAEPQHRNKTPLDDITNVHNGSPIDRKRRFQQRRDSILDSQEFREFNILQHLDHPNIVHLEKVFWSDSTIFILQDLITGGDLFSYVQTRGGGLSAVESAAIVYQLLKGIEYLHDRGIVHRDLKPDNVMISTDINDPLRAIITDFGSSRQIEADSMNQNDPNSSKQRMNTYRGTLHYIAPFVASHMECSPSKC